MSRYDIHVDNIDAEYLGWDNERKRPMSGEEVKDALNSAAAAQSRIDKALELCRGWQAYEHPAMVDDDAAPEHIGRYEAEQRCATQLIAALTADPHPIAEATPQPAPPTGDVPT